MNLRQLEYFLAIARARSLTLAASELGVAQPTLTKSIKGLENELGVSLFRRLPRGVELTQSGEVLLRHAEALQVQLRDAGREINALQGGMSGQVTIGAGPAWLRRHLPLAVARALSGHPGLRARIEGGFDDVLLRALRRGEVDFIVAEIPSPENARDLKIMPLTSDRLGVACRAGHPLARLRRVPMARLLEFPWCMPSLGTRASQRLHALFIAANLPPPDMTVESESMAFLIQTLLNSDTLTYTVSTTLHMPEASGLKLLGVPEIASTREAGVIMRRDGFLTPAAHAIVEELRHICAREPTN